MKNKILFSCLITISFLMNSYQCDAQVYGNCDVLFGNCRDNLVEYLYNNIGTENCVQWDGDCGVEPNIFRMGKVAIGTNTVPSGANLGVKGGIISNLMIIELCGTEGWCDYVFEPEYDLMSLKEVDQFIEKNGHLPNTPSAKEIESNGGFEIKKTQLNHQEKIEEIFLHLIDLNKRVDLLRAELAALESENKELKNQ